MERRALLVTHHGKGDVLRPVFEEHSWILDDIDLDTDVLGTFSGDVPRTFTPLETVRRKALMGTAHGDGPWFVASEGSIASDVIGLTRDVEIVALVSRNGSTIVAGSAVGYDTAATQLRIHPTDSESEIVEGLSRGFDGGHHLIASRQDHRVKAIGALGSVSEVLAACDQLGRDAILNVHTDYRSHLCPSRRPVIAEAARDLMWRMTNGCPHCAQPGFGPAEGIPGRPCAACGAATDELLGRWWRCPTCQFAQARHDDQQLADPSRCNWCNP